MTAIKVDQLVLDDELFILFERYNADVNVDELDKTSLFLLLSKIRLPYKYSADQVFRCYKHLPDSFQRMTGAAILAAGTTDESLKETALRTVHRIILSKKYNTLPFVNIASEKFCSDFSITVKPGEPRTEIQAHIKELLKGAESIHIYDQYLHSAIDRNNFDISLLIPNPSIKIFCHDMKKMPKNLKTKKLKKKFRPNYYALKHHCTQCRCHNDVCYAFHSYDKMHDRYLIIDHKKYSYQVVLSSGFEYLFSDKKEITCVFRKR